MKNIENKIYKVFLFVMLERSEASKKGDPSFLRMTKTK